MQNPSLHARGTILISLPGELTTLPLPGMEEAMQKFPYRHREIQFSFPVVKMPQEYIVVV